MHAVGSTTVDRAVVEYEGGAYTCSTAIKCDHFANYLRIAFSDNVVFECHTPPGEGELLNPVAYQLARSVRVSVEQVAA